MTAKHLAIAADFLLAEKLLEALENETLDFDKISAVELTPFGEEHSLRFKTKAVEQIALSNVDWQQFSHVLFAGKMTQAEQLAAAVKAGCVVVDIYGITALISNVPVIVPGLNDEAVVGVREQNIVALANPQISQLALALKPLLEKPICQILVTSLLPSAYFGDEKVQELAGQTAQLLNGIPLDDEKARVAFDTVPADVQADEKALLFSKAFALQLAKILPNITACTTFHSVQVPVFYGVSQLVSVQTEYPLDAEELSRQWQQQAWMNFNEERVITPVKNGEEEEHNLLQISRLIQHNEHSVEFWSVADEQRFSLAFLSITLLKTVLDY